MEGVIKNVYIGVLEHQMSERTRWDLIEVLSQIQNKPPPPDSSLSLCVLVIISVVL